MECDAAGGPGGKKKMGGSRQLSTPGRRLAINIFVRETHWDLLTALPYTSSDA